MKTFHLIFGDQNALFFFNYVKFILQLILQLQLEVFVSIWQFRIIRTRLYTDVLFKVPYCHCYHNHNFCCESLIFKFSCRFCLIYLSSPFLLFCLAIQYRENHLTLFPYSDGHQNAIFGILAAGQIFMCIFQIERNIIKFF